VGGWCILTGKVYEVALRAKSADVDILEVRVDGIAP